MFADRMFDPYTKQTPDGRAFYPFGSYGAGYIVDPRTERRVKSFIGCFWVGFALVVAASDFVPGPDLAKFLGIIVLAAICHVIFFRYLFRDSHCTAERLTRHEIDRKRAASLSFSYLTFCAGILPLGAALAIWGLFALSAFQDRLVAAIGLAFCGYLGLWLFRIYRIKTSGPDGSAPGSSRAV